jgi:aryl-alcohol dehydrogenase-like predicted oxidoreductase
MQHRNLGANGPQVSAIGLGCMSFGGIFGPTTTTESLACLDAAYDAGITFYDTANIYGMGVSETVIGQWLATRKPKITLATKAGVNNVPTRHFDNSPEHLRSELLSSLKKLGRDHVELFYVHRREQTRPIEEVVGALKDLIAEGLIGAYGLSEISPGTLRRAHAVHPCAAVQNEYSLWTRLPELGLIQACTELGTSLVAFSPLARGALGRHDLDPTTFARTDFRATVPRFIEPDWSLNLARIAAFRAFAADLGVTAPGLAIAWTLDQAPHILPIPGTRSAAHLADWATADQFRWTDEVRTRLAQILPPGWAHGDRYSDSGAQQVERYC